MTDPLTEADQISDIAFGFMGSRALFVALEEGVFTHLAETPLTADDLAELTNFGPSSAETLLTALAGLGLLTVDDGRFANSPAASAFLVQGAKYDFGEYLRLQVGQQMYPLMDQLHDALADRLPEGATASYADWFEDPAEARRYSESQHAGSLGPARQLAGRLQLDGARSMLDVGGGTGAFAITLCRAFPELSATVVEFPNVAALGRRYVEAAGLAGRIRYVDGDALATDWPADQDLVLMSYLFSGVPGERHAHLVRRAIDHLAPGGTLAIHDFVVAADRTGPRLAALWQLQHTAFTPAARSLDAGWLREAMLAAGLDAVSIGPLIPEMTTLATGRRPGTSSTNRV